MMRLLLAFLLCCSLSAYSTSRDSVMRLRTSISPVLAYPLGQFSFGTNQRFLTGQCLPSWGGAVYMSYLVRPHNTLGLSFSNVAFRLHKDKTYQQLTDRYAQPGYANTLTVNYYDFDLSNIAIVASHIISTPILEIEPYLHVGIGIPITNSFTNAYSIVRKKLNDNYSEELSPDMLAKPFFFPAIGLRLSKGISRTVYFFAATQYQYGELRYTYVDAGIDYLGNTTLSTQSFHQPVSVIQLQLGIEIRVLSSHPFHHTTARP